MKEGEPSVASTVPANDNPAGLTVVTAPSSKEELDLKLQQAREQLLVLRRQQEDLERQKGDLEELRRKQDEYTRGRAGMIEGLTRGLVLLEREQIQAQRLAELCAATRQAFAEHLEQVQSLNDQNWTSTNLRSELTKALGTIENAHIEYNRACTKLDCLNPSANPDPDGSAKGQTFTVAEMLRYAKMGGAASLPLIVVGTIWLLIFLIVKR